MIGLNCIYDDYFKIAAESWWKDFENQSAFVSLTGKSIVAFLTVSD